ncbi:DB module, partial [Cooperia oncophora]
LQAPRDVRYQQPYHNAQFAAPQTQVPAIQYPQQQQYVSTLAPLLAAPRPNEINTRLAQQPADLAQPMPDYSRNAQQGGYSLQQQPQYQQAQVQTPYYTTNQDPFQQPASTFGQPFFQQGQQNQGGFQYPQQQTPSPLLNPFQPFMQQGGAGSAQSLLDPFGLFNLGGLGQVTPAPNPFAPQQTGFAANQPLQQPSLAQQQPQQGSYYGQQQQLQYDQQRPNNYNTQARPTVQAYPGQQQQYPAQQQVPAAQPQPLQTAYGQQNGNLQHAEKYAAKQPTTTISISRQSTSSSEGMFTPSNQKLLDGTFCTLNPADLNSIGPWMPMALPRASPSIDAAPINLQKYVDGKGPVPAIPPQQCPRQPGWLPCITKQQANDRFLTCCARLGDGCTPLCNYDAPLATMQLAVLTGRCPLSKMADIMVCASGYEDATACCEAYNVFEPGYEQCRPYCNPAAGLPQGGLLSEKYKCLAKLSHIQQCFYVSQKP